MSAGSKWRLFIPPQLAYGERVVAGIAPNATLVFEVELISIQDKPQTASAAK
jgi:FKBP-type peptidyl-prolyl cis-trans isomerase FklB